MVRSLFVCVLSLSLYSASLIAEVRGTRERAFLQALEIFDAAKNAEDYRESAKILESIVADGFQSGTVFYNLGNAYFRAGEYGRAILSYRKAQPYRPRDPYLKANLQQAIAASPGKLGEQPKPWWNHVLFWNEWISYPMKVQTCFTSLCAAAALVVCAVVLRFPRLHWLAAATLLLSCVIGIDLAIQYNEIAGSRRAIIVKEAIARKGTGNTYEAAFDQPLRDGAEFQVLNETAEWTFGHFEGIGDGWVRNEFVAR